MTSGPDLHTRFEGRARDRGRDAAHATARQAPGPVRSGQLSKPPCQAAEAPQIGPSRRVDVRRGRPQQRPYETGHARQRGLECEIGLRVAARETADLGARVFGVVPAPQVIERLLDPIAAAPPGIGVNETVMAPAD